MMDIKRLRKLAGTLTESYEIEEDVRQSTNKVIEMMDEGLLEPRNVALACLSYMSEDEVADMARSNDFFDDGDDEDDWDEDEDDLEPDYFDDLDAGDTEMDRRSDLRRGW